jgi:homoserine kinase type II
VTTCDFFEKITLAQHQDLRWGLGVTGHDMSFENRLQRLFRHYPSIGAIRRCETLGGAGGFSGARLWKLETATGALCVRRWPEQHPGAERLRYIHTVLEHAGAAGLTFVPLPLRSADGRSFVDLDDSFWEITPWLPGAADYHQAPSPARLRAALQALAHFHRGVEPLESDHARSPGLEDRYRQLCHWRAQGFAPWTAACQHVNWPEFQTRAERLLELVTRHADATERVLCEGCRIPVPLQPAIRDVWHDHILFVGDEVSGIIDFGAMRRDSVAGDVTRLLGSLAGDDETQRRAGLASYEEIRPLTAAERSLLEAFDRSMVLMSGLNWVRWIAIEGRQFPDRARVLSRMDEWLTRLEAWKPVVV